MQYRAPILTYGVGIACALVVAGFFGVLVRETPSHRAELDDILSHSLVVDEATGEAVVQYIYRGDALPSKLAPDEDVQKRTENSYTRDLGVQYVGTSKEQRVYQGVFYTAPIFVQEDGEWYYQESATTTETVFYLARPDLYVAKVFTTPIAEAASFSGFSTSLDGYSNGSVFGEEGAEVSDIYECDSGTHFNFFEDEDAVSTTGQAEARYISVGSGSCSISRAYFPFNTSSIPSGSTVTAATLSVYVTAKTNNVTTSDDIYVVQAPSTIDFFSFGSSSGATPINLGSITTSAYNNWTLNATGLGWITPGGTTYLGLREQHDVQGILGTAGTNRITFYTSEQTGTSNDPSLSVTYTTPTTTFWQFQDF